MAGKPFGNAQHTQQEVAASETSILLEFQLSVGARGIKVQYLRHPKGRYGPDAQLTFPAPNRSWLAECRQKDCNKKTCSVAHPESNVPHPGVEISEPVFKRHRHPFLYLVRFGDCLEYAWIDPLIAYKIGDGFNRKDGSSTDTYFIPVTDFQPILKFPEGLPLFLS